MGDAFTSIDMTMILRLLDSFSLQECRLVCKEWERAYRVVEDRVYEEELRRRNNNKLLKDHEKMGYSYGIVDAQHQFLQDGFNAGFYETAKAAFEDARKRSGIIGLRMVCEATSSDLLTRAIELESGVQDLKSIGIDFGAVKSTQKEALSQETRLLLSNELARFE